MTIPNRILCAWFPAWPIQRRHVAAPDTPALFATIRGERGRRILVDLDAAALAAGLRPGMALTQARTIAPELAVADDDPAADQHALARLAAWAERYTPLAAPDGSHGPADGLLLDITGCAHLCGGEDALLADLARRLAAFGLTAQLALAGTPGAAWALARHAPGLLPPGQEAAALAPLPATALRLPEPLAAALARLGLRRVAALARIPRAELAARFGPLVTNRLDQALGAAAEAITWPRPPSPWQARRAFAEPIGTPEDLARALSELAAELCARLQAADRGGIAFRADFLRVDASRQHLALRLAAPARDAARIARLLADRLDSVDPGFGVDAMLLAADPAPLAATQPGLDDTAPAAPLAATLDALAQHLALWRPAPAASHIPERAVTTLPPAATPATWTTEPATEAPLRLLTPPEPIEATAVLPEEPPLQFRWRGALHRIRAASGPARIAAEWWTTRPHPTRPETDRLRDYYRVEDTAGARFWVFRTGLAGVARWFLHGVLG